MEERVLINVIDIESTCWEKPTKHDVSDIIEIGITVVDFCSLEIVSTESIIVKPTHSSISKFCTDLTTLTPEFVDQYGIPFAQAAYILKNKYMANQRLFASWGNYDKKMFNRQFALYEVEDVFGPMHLNIKALFAHAMELKREVGMGDALKMLGIPLDGTHHRGDDDSRNISKIFIYLLTDPEFIGSLRTFEKDLPPLALRGSRALHSSSTKADQSDKADLSEEFEFEMPT